MTTTRERLDRRNRVARILVIVLGVVVALALAAAALGLWLLPPMLADSPRERFSSATEITLQTEATTPVSSSDPAGASPRPGSGGTPESTTTTAWTVTANASIGAGWLALGVGPFLDPSVAVFVSPDDAYRADLALLPLRGTNPDDALATYLAAHDLGDASAGAAWSEETLTSGLTVRYADVAQGADTITVAMIEQPAAEADPSATTGPDPVADPSASTDPPTAEAGATPATHATTAPAVVILRATVDSADAARYRPVTADLAASVTLTTTMGPAS